jgi:hypothetical protein
MFIGAVIDALPCCGCVLLVELDEGGGGAPMEVHTTNTDSSDLQPKEK